MAEHPALYPKEDVPQLQPISEAVPILLPVSPQQSNHGTPSLLSRLPQVENRFIIGLFLLTVIPLGLYYLVRQPRMSRTQKAIWVAAWLAGWSLLTVQMGMGVGGLVLLSLLVSLVICLGLAWKHPDPHLSRLKRRAIIFVSAFVISAIHVALIAIVVMPIVSIQFRRVYTRANHLWDGGQRSEAVTFYKDVLTHGLYHLENADQQTVVQRVIEFETESGNTASARTFIELAERKGIPIFLKEAKAKAVLAQVRQERSERVAAEQARKEAAKREKREAAERAEKERQERLAAADLKKKERLEREAAERAKKDSEIAGPTKEEPTKPIENKGEKLAAMQKVVKTWIAFSSGAFSDEKAYLAVKKAQEDFSSISFKSKDNREEAKAILRLMTDSKQFSQTCEMIRVAEQTDTAYEARVLMRNLTKEISQITKEVGTQD